MTTLLSVIDRVDDVLSRVLIGLLAFLVLDVCWQVVTRFLLNDPSSYTEEIARFTLIWISLLGAASAYKRGLHLGIDIVTSALPIAARFAAQVFVHLCVIGFALTILIYGGSKLVAMTFQLQQVSAVLGVKMGYIYLAMPISGVLFLVYAVRFLMLSVVSFKNNNEAVAQSAAGN